MLQPRDESIRQRPAPPASHVRRLLDNFLSDRSPTLLTQDLVQIPDWCNAGIAIRIIVAWNFIAMAVAVFVSSDPSTWAATSLNYAIMLEPTLITSLLLGCLARPLYALLPLRLQVIVVVMIPALLMAALEIALAPLLPSHHDALPRDVALTAAAAALTLYWAKLRGQSHLPALAEARLAALQARIRPHFLFNSLNAVLGLIRTDARRAESMIEDLADLFRVLMRDHHERVTMLEEIALCRKYLDIESLRLGQRLMVQMAVDERAEEAMVPLLLLQPLVENAVLHGVEPATSGGLVEVSVVRNGSQVHVMIANPYHGEAARRGHQLGLANVRQRLELLHDLESRLDTRIEDGRFILEMSFPYLRPAKGLL